MTPKDAAQAFFQACADEKWDEAAKLALFPMTDKVKAHLGGVKVISIGEPFKSGLYPGQFVPYAITFKSGEVRKFNLAVRNDNPARQWTVDGGI